VSGVQTLRADLHVHIGATAAGRPVKISASRRLTLDAIRAAAVEKGLDVVGVVDCHVPAVQEELAGQLAAGRLAAVPGGGFAWPEGPLLIPAVEIETCAGAERRPMHCLVYLPDLPALRSFSAWLRGYVRNIDLSSQRCRASLRQVQERAVALGGFLVPAHVFTPHRGMYAAADGLAEVLGAQRPPAVAALELGLSADTELAAGLPELAGITFLSNSDAHSAATMGREYNLIALGERSFSGLESALREGAVRANYGLDPRLGKYHRSFCPSCRQVLLGEPPQRQCPTCGSRAVVCGVLDRVVELRQGRRQPSPTPRPPYFHRVPLVMIPGVGPAARKRLRAAFGCELAAAEAGEQELAAVVGERLAAVMVAARAGRASLVTGGGGRYGRLLAGC